MKKKEQSILTHISSLFHITLIRIIFFKCQMLKKKGLSYNFKSKIVITYIDFIKLSTRISFKKGVHSLLDAQHGILDAQTYSFKIRS